MSGVGRIIVIAAVGIAAAAAVLLTLTGLTVLQALFVGVNVVTLLCYGYDKHQAQSHGRRVPELVLHLLAVVGGTPGAFAGQLVFHHKTRDSRFRRIFFGIAVVQILALFVLLRLRSN